MKLQLIIALLIAVNQITAQNVGINTTGATPNSKALLDIDATGMSPKGGLLIPRLTTAERNAITAPIPMSLLIFNTTTECFEAWNQITTSWVAFGCISCQLPGAFSASAASGITATTFAANWVASAGATTYFLDVATDAAFTTFVSGYNNLNVGNVLTSGVTGLTCGSTYYYRVRANNTCGTSANSNVVITPIISNTITQVFNFTGADQTYTVPSCASVVIIKVWGAAGGDWVATGGSAGGYSSATFNLGTSVLTNGQVVRVMVGKGGTSQALISQPNIYGFGGGSLGVLNPSSTGTGQGGGLSGVFTGNTVILATDMARAIIVAGGGGGSGEDDCKSVNFRRHGGSGNDPINGGGMASMQGIDGNTGTGCTPAGYGGGGGGYNGGTSHTRDGAGGGTYAGNGGTGFIHGTATTPNTQFTPEFSGVAPNTTDTNYNGNAAANSTGNGNNGLVVIISY